jgi:hypothetical protein
MMREAQKYNIFQPPVSEEKFVPLFPSELSVDRAGYYPSLLD